MSLQGPLPDLDVDETKRAAIGRAAARLAGYFQGQEETLLSQAAAHARVARRVAGGADVLAAALAVRRSIERRATIAQPVGDIDPATQRVTTVEGTVLRLWTADDGTIPAGVFRDAAGDEFRFTVWPAAQPLPPLEEGSVIRAERVQLDEADGSVYGYLTGDTTLTVLDGAAAGRRR